jgi:hypothetical protein
MTAAAPAQPVMLQVRAAVVANLRPGMVLWSALALLLLAYAWSPAVQAGLARWGTLKLAWGYPFSFVSYGVFAVLVPEFLGYVVLKRPWPAAFWSGIVYVMLVFGALGVAVDVLYTLQASLFGEGQDFATAVKKMLVDQFVFAPFANFVVVAMLAWGEGGFRAHALRKVLTLDYTVRHYLPVLVALWCIWVPSVMAVYFMPTALQFPMASLILSFWVLIFKFIRKG